MMWHFLYQSCSWQKKSFLMSLTKILRCARIRGNSRAVFSCAKNYLHSLLTDFFRNRHEFVTNFCRFLFEIREMTTQKHNKTLSRNEFTFFQPCHYGTTDRNRVWNHIKMGWVNWKNSNDQCYTINL